MSSSAVLSFGEVLPFTNCKTKLVISHVKADQNMSLFWCYLSQLFSLSKVAGLLLEFLDVSLHLDAPRADVVKTRTTVKLADEVLVTCFLPEVKQFIDKHVIVGLQR